MTGSAKFFWVAFFFSASSFSLAFCFTGFAFSASAASTSSFVGSGIPETISAREAFPIGTVSSSFDSSSSWASNLPSVGFSSCSPIVSLSATVSASKRSVSLQVPVLTVLTFVISFLEIKIKSNLPRVAFFNRSYP